MRIDLPAPQRGRQANQRINDSSWVVGRGSSIRVFHAQIRVRNRDKNASALTCMAQLTGFPRR